MTTPKSKFALSLMENPVRIKSAIGAVLALLVLYGILNEIQAAAWLAVVMALFEIVAGEKVRNLVSPVKKLNRLGLPVPPPGA